jgi:hypothetical protein
MKWILNLLITIAFLLIIFDILIYFNGSLELIPSEEQSEKFQIVTILTGFILTATELILIFIRIKND